jgi:hypothetical protein
MGLRMVSGQLWLRGAARRMRRKIGRQTAKRGLAAKGFMTG